MTNSNYTPEISVTEVSLLKRAAVFLEDGEFDRADEYCERVLDMNVENGEAYLYKLLAALRLCDKNSLRELEEPFNTHPCYLKIMRFGSEQLKREVESINSSIVTKAEEKRAALLFEMAKEQSESESITELTEAYAFFVSHGKSEQAEACRTKIENIYDTRYNELYLAAKETEQALNDRQYQNSTDVMEKDDYDQYIKDNRGKKIFDYSFLVAAAVAIFCILAIIFSVNDYLTLAGITFKTVLRCIFTKIIPGMPLTCLSVIISFRISKRLVKKQRANLIEDIGTAAERAKEIGEKISNAENESFMLKRTLDERLEALKKLNAEYDAFLAEKEKESCAQI